MRVKLIVLIILLIISFGFTDKIDFLNWSIRFSVKEKPEEPTEFQNLLEAQAKSIIKQIYYDSCRTVAEYLSENPKINKQFARLNINPQEYANKFLSDGSLIMEYEVPITGPILKTLIPYTGGGTPLVPLCCPICKRPWPENVEVPKDVKLIPLEEDSPRYTGVLIDARDISLNPALFPKIYTDDNREAYGLSFVKPEYCVERGLLVYTSSLTEAFQNERVGINPIRITALKSIGKNNTDIVISSSAGKLLHSSQNNLKLLEQCKVVVLISE
ncbi:MAG: hypothetical protein N2201_00730 [candidate division WOR-3 bacterium]|nr:hypothetical protein [candidate division WOR-3 bacterium]